MKTETKLPNKVKAKEFAKNVARAAETIAKKHKDSALQVALSAAAFELFRQNGNVYYLTIPAIFRVVRFFLDVYSEGEQLKRGGYIFLFAAFQSLGAPISALIPTYDVLVETNRINDEAIEEERVRLIREHADKVIELMQQVSDEIDKDNQNL